MPIIDTHCHYNLEPLYSGAPFCFKIKDGDAVLTMDWRAHLTNAHQHQIDKSVIVGAGLRSSQKAVELATAETSFYASIGIHPERAHKIEKLEQAMIELEKLAANPKVVAVGEIGLDYFYAEPNVDQTNIKKKQHELFIAQIKLANRLQLPLILHVRDHAEAACDEATYDKTAYAESLILLKEHFNFDSPIIFHCVSGPLAYIRQALQLKNSYFGFDGNITFKKANDLRIIFQLVQETDPKKILLETDAPYLAPEPHRGKICEPWMIAVTASYLKKNFHVNLAEIYQNSLNAFRIN